MKSTLSGSWIYHYFLLSHLFKRDKWCVPWFDKNCRWLFHWHCSSEVFQTLQYYNLAWGRPVYTRFGDLDHVSNLGMLTFRWWWCCSLCFWHKPTELGHSFLFCSYVYFCLYGLFNCISFHKFSWQLHFLTLLFQFYFCIIGPFNYIYLSVKVSFRPDIILCGWPGWKNQLTNCFFKVTGVSEFIYKLLIDF